MYLMHLVIDFLQFQLFSHCRKRCQNDLSCVNLGAIAWMAWEIIYFKSNRGWGHAHFLKICQPQVPFVIAIHWTNLQFCILICGLVKVIYRFSIAPIYNLVLPFLPRNTCTKFYIDISF